MTREFIQNKLNFWTQNENFSFDADKHEYHFKNKVFTSVTTFTGLFKPKFNADYHAQKKADELNTTKEEILAHWKNIADVACNLGTNVHEWIEHYLDGENPEIPEDDNAKNRILKFKEIYGSWLNKFEPIAQEIRLFSEDWQIAGTADALFYYPKNGCLYVGDWKTNKEYKHDGHPKGTYNKMLPPFEKIWSNEQNAYSIQVSLYRLILEQQGLETNGAFLCHIGPETPAKIWPALDFRAELKYYLNNTWKKKLKEKEIKNKYAI